jgi:hypothetical protein
MKDNTLTLNEDSVLFKDVLGREVRVGDRIIQVNSPLVDDISWIVFRSGIVVGCNKNSPNTAGDVKEWDFNYYSNSANKVLQFAINSNRYAFFVFVIPKDLIDPRLVVAHLKLFGIPFAVPKELEEDAHYHT